MKEMTATRFYDTLYKFFAVLCCLGLGMLAMDILMILAHKQLYLLHIPLSGYQVVLTLGLDGFVAIGSYMIAKRYLRLSRELKWR